MAETIGEAFVKIRADVSQFNAEIDKGTGASFNRIATTAGAALVAAGGFATKLSQDLIRAQGDLKITIENTGRNFDDYSSKINATVKTQEKFGHSASDTNQALTNLTVKLGDPTKALANFNLVTEYAALKHISLADASVKVGKALSGNKLVLKSLGIDTNTAATATKDLEKATTAHTKAVDAVAAATQRLHDKEAILNSDGRPNTVAQEIALKTAREKVTEATDKLHKTEQDLTKAQGASNTATAQGADVTAQLNAKLKGYAEEQSKTLEGHLARYKVDVQDFIAAHSKMIGPIIAGTGTAVGALSNLVTVLDSTAAKSIASWTAQAAIAVVKAPLIAAKWVFVAAQAAVSGALQAAQWTIAYGLKMEQAIADFTASVVKVVAGWVVMGVKAAVNAAIVAFQWVVAFGKQMALALAEFLVTVGRVVAGWILMAVEATAQAVIIAAAWLISLGPIAILVAAVIGAVTLIVTHWQGFKDGVVRISEDVVRFIESLPGRIIGVFSGAWNWLWNAGKNIIDGLIAGIKAGIKDVEGVIGTVVNLVKKIPVVGWAIGSPSKLFETYGQNLMQGLKLGVTGQLPSVENLFKGPVMKAASFGGSASATGFQPSLAGGGGQTIQGPLVHIENANIRNEEDITKLARAIYKLQAKNQRASGMQVSPV